MEHFHQMEEMASREHSRVPVQVVFISVLVSLATLLFGGGAYLAYQSESRGRREGLRQEVATSTNQLATSLILPTWYLDQQQITQILDQMMENPLVQEVSVEIQAGSLEKITRERGPSGVVRRESSSPTRSQAKELGLIWSERDISHSGRTIGRVHLAYTTRILETDLHSFLKQSLWSLAGLDLLLVTILSSLLWWVVIRPLREIERLAGFVSSGADVGSLIPSATFYGQFASVRHSLLRTFDLLKKDIAARAHTEAALQRLNRELRAVSDCNQVLVRAEDEQSLLEDICHIVCDKAGYCLAWVGYVENDEAKTIRPVAWAGEESGYLEHARFTWADTERGHGPAGVAIRSRKSTFIQNLATDPYVIQWQDNLLQRGYRSLIDLPLKDEVAMPFGLLCIYSAEPNAFSPEEIRLLEELAGDLAFGIRVLRARLEHKSAEEALRKSETKNTALINAIPDLIFTFSRDGEYLTVNASDRSLLYQPMEALLHRNILEIMPMPLSHQWMTNITESIDLDTVKELKYSLTIGEEIKYFEARVAPCAKDTVIAMVRDVTKNRRIEEQQRNLQAQFQQAQKMESLGILAGGVAHDMNNVLGAILGLASANVEAQPEGSQVRKAFEIIIKATERGGKMVKSLLGFARKNPTEVRQIYVNALLREEVHLLEHTTLSKVHFQMDLAPDLLPIYGDESSLSNIFMNLCVNAVDAIPGNGTITLRTRNLDNGWIEVQVEDNGTGMSKEVLEKALDPFFTTKKLGKGTGLGLSMVYSTVMVHHGKLEIQSEPGKGTCVTMVFPAPVPAASFAEPATESLSESVRQSLSILLVDDDDLIQISMQALLDAMGHSPTVVSSGEEALAKLESGFKPDVVILDMNMPGLGGAGTLPHLRALLPTVPILLVTGRVDQTALDLVRVHPCVTLLSKPFSMGDLQEHLESLGNA